MDVFKVHVCIICIQLVCFRLFTRKIFSQSKKSLSQQSWPHGGARGSVSIGRCKLNRASSSTTSQCVSNVLAAFSFNPCSVYCTDICILNPFVSFYFDTNIHTSSKLPHNIPGGQAERLSKVWATLNLWFHSIFALWENQIDLNIWGPWATWASKKIKKKCWVRTWALILWSSFNLGWGWGGWSFTGGSYQPQIVLAVDTPASAEPWQVREQAVTWIWRRRPL